VLAQWSVRLIGKNADKNINKQWEKAQKQQTPVLRIEREQWNYTTIWRPVE
jgi:hypothetical protein